MIKNTFIGLSLIATLLLPPTVTAEHAAKADPKHYTVEFENDRIRVRKSVV